MKKIIICADDFGKNRSVSRGIIALMRKNAVSATGALVTAKNFSEQAPGLKEHLNDADIGLQFNLTEGNALGPIPSLSYTFELPTLSRLIKYAYLYTLSIPTIKTELLRQIAHFQKHLGILPHFISGHQYIHQFPQISTAVIEVYQEHFKNSGMYIRSTADIHSTGRNRLKTWFISHTGARSFQKQLIRSNIPHNASFSGIYDFKETFPYATHFRAFLETTGDQGLIMCHPGFESNDTTDPLMRRRVKEYEYFNSDTFKQDLRETQTVIARFKDFY